MKKFIFSIFIFLFILLFPLSSFSASVTLAWDANNPTPDGYRLFMRTENAAYNYSQTSWQGTATTATITNVPDAETVYFVVRAYEGTSESGDSNEVAYNSDSSTQKVIDIIFIDSSNWVKKKTVEYYGSTADSLTCSWKEFPGSEGYEVRLFHVERNVENLVANGKTQNTSLTFQLPRTGHYIVKVRSCINNYSECTEWSESSDPITSKVDTNSKGWEVYGHVGSPGGPVIE